MRPCSAWLETTPSSRLLFLRRPGRHTRARRARVRRACRGDARTRSGASSLGSPDELADVDLGRGGEPIATPLVLVCGHGARDACCALRGTAVYAALAERLDEDQLWLSSHQGGHRFAANVLVLPLGSPPRARRARGRGTVVARALSGRIDLAHYRGRSVYPARVQAAELAVRTARELDAVADLELVDADGAIVRFRDQRRHGARRDRRGARRADRAGELRSGSRAAGAASSRASRDRPRPSGPEAIRVVGDPDDHLAQALGRIPDGDERPERHARIASGHERRRAPTSSPPMTLRARGSAEAPGRSPSRRGRRAECHAGCARRAPPRRRSRRAAGRTTLPASHRVPAPSRPRCGCRCRRAPSSPSR